MAYLFRAAALENGGGERCHVTGNIEMEVSEFAIDHLHDTLHFVVGLSCGCSGQQF